MKYVVLDGDRVLDILLINPKVLYPLAEYIEVEDDAKVSLGMIYDNKTNSFAEYIEPAPEPTQLDRIEANMDYLVLLNS